MLGRLEGAEAWRYLRAHLTMGRMQKWGPTLDRLEGLEYWANQVIGEFENRVAGTPSIRIEVLLYLHLKASKTADEIIALLRSDLPRGAVARWRTLHEYAISISFLADSDDETAELFRRHEHMRADKEIVHHHRLAKEYDLPRLDSDFVREANRRVEEVREDLGDDFMREWGWAHDALLQRSDRYRQAVEKGRRSHPTLPDVSYATELAPFDSQYALASAAVHSSTDLNGRLPEEVMFGIAGHNTAQAILVIVVAIALSEETETGGDLDSAVGLVAEIAAKVGSEFESDGPPATSMLT